MLQVTMVNQDQMFNMALSHQRFTAVRDPLICQRGRAIPSPQTTSLYQSPLKTVEKAKESSSSTHLGLVCHILLLCGMHMHGGGVLERAETHLLSI